MMELPSGDFHQVTITSCHFVCALLVVKAIITTAKNKNKPLTTTDRNFDHRKQSEVHSGRKACDPTVMFSTLVLHHFLDVRQELGHSRNLLCVFDMVHLKLNKI